MQRLKYYLLLSLFPLFFILHGVNENFGLLSIPTIMVLFLKYLAIALAIGLLSTLIVKNEKRSFLFSFFLLCIYFFFGVLKELLKGTPAGKYMVLLVVLPALVLLIYLLLTRVEKGLDGFFRFVRLFLFIIVLTDMAILLVNLLGNRLSNQDFGDKANKLADSVKLSTKPVNRPDIFWIVMDEYASSNVLKNHFNISNPLDSFLRRKDFFVADSAYSNYNYTHFSLSSQLDMVYLNGFNNHSIVTLRDAMRGNFSLYKNNTSEILKSFGYKIENLSIYDLEGAPTRGMTPFLYTPRSLIDNQTLSGKISRDLSWQFPIIFRSDKAKALQDLNQKLVTQLDETYKAYHQTLFATIKAAAEDSSPVFLMAHLFDAHEPFIYNSDGSLYSKEGLNAGPKERYIPQLLYSNNVIQRLIDSIQGYSQKDYVIILQGDHGFKFGETDPLFDKESCSTLFSVYYKNGNYRAWPSSLTTVNAFRILFNDKFSTRLPLLDNRKFNLLYRSKGED